MPAENRIWGRIDELVVVPSYSGIDVFVVSKKISMVVFDLETPLAVFILLYRTAQPEAYVLVRLEFDVVRDLYQHFAFLRFSAYGKPSLCFKRSALVSLYFYECLDGVFFVFVSDDKHRICVVAGLDFEFPAVQETVSVSELFRCFAFAYCESLKCGKLCAYVSVIEVRGVVCVCSVYVEVGRNYFETVLRVTVIAQDMTCV